MKTFVLLLLIPLVACAAEDEKRVAADRLMSAMRFDEQVGFAMDAVSRSHVDRFIRESKMEDSDNRIAGELLEASLKVLESDEFRQAIVDAYIDVYTIEEMAALTEFFESPIGQSYLDKAPAMSLAVSKVIEVMMPSIQQEIDQVAQNYLDAANGN